MSAAAYGYADFAKECHTGPLDVMEIGNAVVWAGKWVDMDDDLTWTLRIRLNDMWRGLNSAPLVAADEDAQQLLSAYPELFAIKYPPTISLDWPDYGVPPMDKEWWQSLADAIAALPPDSHVAVYCQGGHGRTGTALSILASLSGVVPKGGDPIDWVRRNYCGEAVESWSQVEYVQKITGELSSCIPAAHKKKGGKYGAQFPLWSQDANGKWMADYGNTATSAVEGAGVVGFTARADGSEEEIIPSYITKSAAKATVHTLAKKGK